MSHGIIPINKCKRVEGNRKSTLEHHSKNCCRQDSPMNAYINRQKLKEKDNTYLTSKYLPQN